MKVELDCTEVRYRLALEPESGEPALRGHLAACRACSAEALWIARFCRCLTRSAVVEPGATLDAAVRALFSEMAPRRPFPRASMAAAIAGLGLLSLVLGLGTILAQSGAAEQGLAVSVILTSAYLALSAAALTPLLLRCRAGGAAARDGVKS